MIVNKEGQHLIGQLENKHYNYRIVVTMPFEKTVISLYDKRKKITKIFSSINDIPCKYKEILEGLLVTMKLSL